MIKWICSLETVAFPTVWLRNVRIKRVRDRGNTHTEIQFKFWTY